MEGPILVRDARTAALTLASGLLLIGAGLTGLWSGDGIEAAGSISRWWFALPLAVACAAQLFKRAAPVPSLMVGAAAFTADSLLGGSIATLLPFLDLMYTAALVSSARVRRVLWGAAVVLVAVPVALRLAETGSLQFTVLTGLQQAAIFLCPLWWAMDVGRKSELAELAAARASAVERLADANRQEAVRAERDAMARDLHDVIASHLSAIALHSGGALATPPAAEKDRGALEQVRRSALDSMEDMRAMIALLRSESTDDDGSSPQRLSRLKPLLATARANGLNVRCEQGELGGLSPGTELVGYRIVQEALTNAAKHAPRSEVSVRVDRQDGRVSIVVRNPLHRKPDLPPAGLGMGLTGMAERARSIGGTVEVDSASDMWTVRAMLPAVAVGVEVST